MNDNKEHQDDRDEEQPADTVDNVNDKPVTDDTTADAKPSTDDTDGAETTDDTADNADGEGDTDPYEQIAQLGDDLALARADLYNLNQEYSNYVRRSKEAASQHRTNGQTEVLEALIPVLDDIQAARDAGDLQDGPFAAIADKLERSLNTAFTLERYGKAGEEFDPNLHDALMAEDDAEVTVATIGQVLQPGYRTKDKVLRPTKVLVHNPA